MAGSDVKSGFELQELYRHLYGQTDSRLPHRVRVAEVIAVLDRKLGPCWQRKFNADQLDLFDVARCPCPPKCELLEKLQEYVESAENKIISSEDSLQQKIEIAIRFSRK